MEFFLVSFFVGGNLLTDIAIHDSEDTMLLEAWYAIKNNFLDSDEQARLMDILAVASESDHPYEAFKDICFDVQNGLAESISIKSISKITYAEYNEKKEAYSQLTSMHEDVSLCIASALVNNNLTLVVDVNDYQ